MGIIRPLYTFQVFHIQLSWAVCYATGREHQALEKHNAPRWSRPLGCRDFSRYSLLASLIAEIIIERTQSIVNAFWCLLLSYSFLTRWNSTDAKRVYCSGGCAALRRLRKRPPISARSGENATGEADGFLWRGCAITPALRAGQQGLGKALPNK